MLIRPMLIAALAGLALAVPQGAHAADLGPDPERGRAGEAAGRTAIVVPDCEERLGARLLGCVPREAPDSAEDTGLLQIEGTMLRPRRLPYPQLLDRP